MFLLLRGYVWCPEVQQLFCDCEDAGYVCVEFSVACSQMQSCFIQLVEYFINFFFCILPLSCGYSLSDRVPHAFSPIHPTCTQTHTWAHGPIDKSIPNPYHAHVYKRIPGRYPIFWISTLAVFLWLAPAAWKMNPRPFQNSHLSKKDYTLLMFSLPPTPTWG